MDSQVIERLAGALLKGEPPAAPPWDVGAAVRLLADRLAQPGAGKALTPVRCVRPRACRGNELGPDAIL